MLPNRRGHRRAGGYRTACTAVEVELASSGLQVELVRGPGPFVQQVPVRRSRQRVRIDPRLERDNVRDRKTRAVGYRDFPSRKINAPIDLGDEALGHAGGHRAAVVRIRRAVQVRAARFLQMMDHLVGRVPHARDVLLVGRSRVAVVKIQHRVRCARQQRNPHPRLQIAGDAVLEKVLDLMIQFRTRVVGERQVVTVRLRLEKVRIVQ